jgi:hypothetical protein
MAVQVTLRPITPPIMEFKFDQGQDWETLVQDAKMVSEMYMPMTTRPRNQEQTVLGINRTFELLLERYIGNTRYWDLYRNWPDAHRWIAGTKWFIRMADKSIDRFTLEITFYHRDGRTYSWTTPEWREHEVMTIQEQNYGDDTGRSH